MKLVAWLACVGALLVTGAARAEGIHTEGLSFDVRGARVCWLEPAELHVDADCTDVDPPIKVPAVTLPQAREEPWVDEAFANGTVKASREQAAKTFKPPVVMTVDAPTVEVNGDTRFVAVATRIDGLPDVLERKGGLRSWMFEVPTRSAAWIITLAGNEESATDLNATAEQSQKSVSLDPRSAASAEHRDDRGVDRRADSRCRDCPRCDRRREALAREEAETKKEAPRRAEEAEGSPDAARRRAVIARAPNDVSGGSRRSATPSRGRDAVATLGSSP